MQTCLICDDHAIIREALAAMLQQTWPDAAITYAADFPSAWMAAEATPFDLCLSDLSMPGAEPLAGITRLQTSATSMPILVITGQDDDDLLMALLTSGVAGFLPKSSPSAVMAAAIHLILAGGRYVPQRLISLVPQTTSARANLTQRQTDVLRAVARGLTTKEIAQELGLAPSTVKSHLDQAMLTLNARNRADAVRRAGDLG